MIAKLLVAALFLMMQTYPTPGPGGSAAPSTIYGQNAFTGGSSAPGVNGLLVGIYFVPTANETAVSCSVMLATNTNASGGQIDCGLYSGTATQFTTPLCHATYTAGSANLAAQTITVNLTGCGTLTSGSGYWIIENNNDAGFAPQTYTCGGTCTGAAGTNTYPEYYAVETYGSYPSSVSGIAGPDRASFYLLATP